ncbi:ABC transporter permease [Promicromonospora sp. NPDC060204]|uniref:ABC transporter permease n=1 Tax=Promicromonospora sp. NPDC060204 TaxID=3347071 RepID=UPI00365A29E0
MSFLNTLLGELRKTVTLPASGLAAAGTLVGSAGITVLNAFGARAALDSGAQGARAFQSAFETGYAAVPLGTVGAVVIGVVAISSEYAANSPDAGGGRQITATLAASPHRVRLLVAKALSVLLLVVATAAVTISVCVALAGLIIGDTSGGPSGSDAAVGWDEATARSAGAGLYWTLTALLALAVTVLTRSGIVPLVVLVTNSSLVSFSLLLTHVTPLAHWLPDMAGRRLFGGLSTVEGGLDVLPGALVMAAWTAGLLAVAGVVFSRRDA